MFLLKRSQLRDLSIEDKQKLSNRLYKQGLLLAFLCMGSFFVGVGWYPDSGLWVIPVAAGYMGTCMSGTDRRHLNTLVALEQRIALGTDSEEYF